jgi:hypothetical protein
MYTYASLSRCPAVFYFSIVGSPGHVRTNRECPMLKLAGAAAPADHISQEPAKGTWSFYGGLITKLSLCSQLLEIPRLTGPKAIFVPLTHVEQMRKRDLTTHCAKTVIIARQKGW